MRTTFVQYLIAFCGRPEADSDAMSGVVIDPTGMKVRVNWSNHSRDIRLPHFVTNDDDTRRTPVITKQGHHNNGAQAARLLNGFGLNFFRMVQEGSRNCIHRAGDHRRHHKPFG